MKKIAMTIVSTAFFAGCFTEPKIESTKPWEGHYYSFKDLEKNISTAALDEDESIWLMSNHTLNRLLKNTKK